MQVTIVDTRKSWMIAEDNLFLCMNKCSMWRRCQTRVGADCRRLGGSTIPKRKTIAKIGLSGNEK